MKNVTILIVLAVALGACRESPRDTAEDVAEARQEGAQEVQEAREDRAEAYVDAERDDGRFDASSMGRTPEEQRADADFDLAKAEAQSALDVRLEQCDAMEGDAADRCEQEAEATYDKAVAEAELRRTNALKTAGRGD